MLHSQECTKLPMNKISMGSTKLDIVGSLGLVKMIQKGLLYFPLI